LICLKNASKFQYAARRNPSRVFNHLVYKICDAFLAFTNKGFKIFLSNVHCSQIFRIIIIFRFNWKQMRSKFDAFFQLIARPKSIGICWSCKGYTFWNARYRLVGFMVELSYYWKYQFWLKDKSLLWINL